MDFSTIPEEQRQQLHDLQRRFEEHRHPQYVPQQEQQDQFQVQSYHRSTHAHDQSHQPYREYYQYQHHYYHHQYQPPQSTPLPPENGDYSYTHYEYYQKTTPVHPPGAPFATESTAQIGYSSAERPAHLELIPAAAAAVAELDVLSATIDMARRTVVRLYGGARPEHVAGCGPYSGSLHSPANQLPQIGNGRGRSNHHMSVKGRAPRGHHSTLGGSALSCSEQRRELRAKGSLKRPPSSTNPKKVVEASSNEGKKAWLCDLCKVECNSKKILEQHKSGRKHKKNLEKLEGKMKIADNGPSCIVSNEQKPPSESEEGTRRGEETKQTVTKNLPSEKLDSVEPLLHATAESQPGVANADLRIAPLEPEINHHESQRNGMKKDKKKKKKKNAISGGVKKRMKTVHRKPKTVIPLLCDLCNVKCDTQEVLNKHLAGKKHTAKVKECQGHQAMFGPMGLQASYPPNPISQSSFYHPQDLGFPQQEMQQASYDPHTAYSQVQGTSF